MTLGRCSRIEYRMFSEFMWGPSAAGGIRSPNPSPLAQGRGSKQHTGHADAADVRRSTERNKILDVLRDATEPLGPIAIAQETGMRRLNVRQLLLKLVIAGEVLKVQIMPNSSIEALPTVPSSQR